MYYKSIVCFIFFVLISSLYCKDTECVVICGGNYSYAYHSNSSCSGLNRCNGGIFTVTLSEAKGIGRIPCKKCGGYPFIANIKTEEEIAFDREIEKYQLKISDYENKRQKLNKRVDELKFSNDSLKKIIKILNSPFKYKDTFSSL